MKKLLIFSIILLFCVSLFAQEATVPTIRNTDYNDELLGGEMFKHITTVMELDSLDNVSTTLYAIYDLSNPAIMHAVIEAHIQCPDDTGDTTKLGRVYAATSAIEDSTLTITQLASNLQTISQALVDDVLTVQQVQIGTATYPLNQYLYIFYDVSDVTTDYFDITVYLTLY